MLLTQSPIHPDRGGPSTSSPKASANPNSMKPSIAYAVRRLRTKPRVSSRSYAELSAHMPDGIARNA